MESEKQPTGNNDFPVANALNAVLLAIVGIVRKSKAMNLPEDYELNELNRSYVLLVDELEQIYDRNTKLCEISPRPFWRQFDTLTPHSWWILKHLDASEQDKGQAHMTRIERLCIVEDCRTPELSTKQLDILKAALVAVTDYRQILADVRLDIEEKMEDSWYISDYRLDYETNGAIVINKVFILKRAHIDSTLDQLLEQAFENEGSLFIPNLPQTARNISTVLSSAGFTPELRRLFFPVVSNSKGVLFRSTISFAEASGEGIETTELDLILKALGANLSFSG